MVPLNYKIFAVKGIIDLNRQVMKNLWTACENCPVAYWSGASTSVDFWYVFGGLGVGVGGLIGRDSKYIGLYFRCGLKSCGARKVQKSHNHR